MDIDAPDEASALEKATALAERLLSNPVIENASARIGTSASGGHE
jgi:phosphoribosylformylglycinamidine (FGAM) synthase PurS component